MAICENGAGSWSVQSGNQIEESRFAGAGGTKESEEFVAGDRQGDVIDGADAGFAHGVVTRDVSELDSGFEDRHLINGGVGA